MILFLIFRSKLLNLNLKPSKICWRSSSIKSPSKDAQVPFYGIIIQEELKVLTIVLLKNPLKSRKKLIGIKKVGFLSVNIKPQRQPLICLFLSNFQLELLNYCPFQKEILNKIQKSVYSNWKKINAFLENQPTNLTFHLADKIYYANCWVKILNSCWKMI